MLSRSSQAPVEDADLTGFFLLAGCFQWTLLPCPYLGDALLCRKWIMARG